MNRITHTCKNITLATTSLWPVKRLCEYKTSVKFCDIFDRHRNKVFKLRVHPQRTIANVQRKSIEQN